MEFDDDYMDSDAYDYNSVEEDDYIDEDELTDDLLKAQTKPYTVVTEEVLRQRQEDAMAEVCAVLSVSRAAAIILLLHHQWNVNNLKDAWFADEEAVRKAVGLSSESPPQTLMNYVDCGICFEGYPFCNVGSANCGHYYCKGCWRSYIYNAVEDGSGCLTLRCPEPSCRAAVDQNMIHALARDPDRVKYVNYLARSYVELNRDTKWCPAPGCDKAIEFDAGGAEDVYCDCANGFCWSCEEEAHRPLDCETVNKWITKNSSESENTTWIIANSKPCPKCRKPIEKNQGCMHMTCRCGHQFCWICLRDWTRHSDKTGGFYACNGYSEGGTGAAGDVSEDERRRLLAKRAIEKYTHYYERWAANHKSWKQSLEHLRVLQEETLEEFSELRRLPVTEMGFVVDAWKQVVECRRVLKWTYAYGYYLAEEDFAKKQFFEYLQGDAESGLERLHLVAEKELKYQIDDYENIGVEEFKAFSIKLVGLTNVTRKYFEKLVTALEDGLPDVASGSSGNAVNSRMPPWWEVELEDQPDGWACDRCTYMNPMDAEACVMCFVGDGDDWM